MKKYTMALALAGAFFSASAQELFPYTEPASNMPSHSVSAKLTAMYMRSGPGEKVRQRYMPEVMFGLNKKWMLHGALLFANMHGGRFAWEGVRGYAKYRFLSADEVHRHFRMAAFGAAAWSRNRPERNDMGLTGDYSGVQGGLIATQLLDRWAFSATASTVQLLRKERWQKEAGNPYAYSALEYSLSSGVLVLPRVYTDYNQTNLNLYVELLGHRNLGFDREKYYVDLAPALQLIFNSTGKLNVGYRFEVAGDIDRLSRDQVMISYEQIFLDALKPRARRRYSGR